MLLQPSWPDDTDAIAGVGAGDAQGALCDAKSVGEGLGQVAARRRSTSTAVTCAYTTNPTLSQTT